MHRRSASSLCVAGAPRSHVVSSLLWYTGSKARGGIQYFLAEPCRYYDEEFHTHTHTHTHLFVISPRTTANKLTEDGAEEKWAEEKNMRNSRVKKRIPDKRDKCGKVIGDRMVYLSGIVPG